MLLLYSDWERGIHPVALGRAPWLPAVFIQAMHSVGAARSKEASDAHRRSREKFERRAGQRP